MNISGIITELFDKNMFSLKIYTVFLKVAVLFSIFTTVNENYCFLSALVLPVLFCLFFGLPCEYELVSHY